MSSNPRSQVVTPPLSSILESTAVGILSLDLSGRITFANHAAARMTGYSLAELLGANAHDRLHHTRSDGSPYPIEDCPIERVVGAGSARPVLGELFWRKDGTSFPVEYSCSPLQSAGALPTGATVSFTDITEHQTHQNQLVQSQKLESIGQLAAGIAHEINTPTQYVAHNIRFLETAFQELSVLLKHYGQLLESARTGTVDEALVTEIDSALQEADVDYLSAEILSAVHESTEGIDRVKSIVHAMKDFSHPGGTEKSSVNLNNAIESTVTVARNEWKYVAQLRLELDPELPLVFCLPGEVNQVIVNLLVNAAHAIADRIGSATEERGEIRVVTRQDGDFVEIRVSDTGTGIPANVRDHIFDPFFTTKDVGQGTGQGLSLAHSIVVDKHGGELNFETESGVGTTFIVRLPIGYAEADEELPRP